MATNSKSLFDTAMKTKATDIPNVRQAVPFFNVKNIQASLRFYVEGLGFTVTREWIPERQLRWCCLSSYGGAQCFNSNWKGGQPEGACSFSVRACPSASCARCHRHLSPSEDARAEVDQASCRQQLMGHIAYRSGGYRLAFESPTDVSEDTVYSD